MIIVSMMITMMGNDADYDNYDGDDSDGEVMMLTLINRQRPR